LVGIDECHVGKPVGRSAKPLLKPAAPHTNARHPGIALMETAAIMQVNVYHTTNLHQTLGCR
jgi:hypothetical protein